jgi:hypothetical protein
MQNAAPVHPSREVLEGFALGKLPPDEAAEIESHLADCTQCGQAVQQTPADSFIGLVRSAHVLVAPSPVPRGADLTATPTPNADSSLRVAAVTVGSSTETAQAPLDVPAELVDHPRYRVEALLGRGGMGAVYKAEHRLMERWVALKIIGHDLSARAELVERFRREVKAAARLSHPNIVTAHDAEQAGPRTSWSWSTSRAPTWPGWWASAARCRWRRPAATCGRRRWGFSTPTIRACDPVAACEELPQA